jgi:hypothetical protein
LYCYMTFPMTSGAKLLTEAAAPYFTRLMFGGKADKVTAASSLTTRWVAVPAAKVRRLLVGLCTS